MEKRQDMGMKRFKAWEIIGKLREIEARKISSELAEAKGKKHNVNRHARKK